ncbi:Tachylectin [Lentzea albidocapillata subsp. violacea]|uniref:Tachylectin n=1 Tax=Lentzea albidocapillata subsp. violacea TaxID=128104 RepID=A0A1G9SZQ3_9PSEU|nr:tachylectin-related carbohydrate-binding protein [Lentzea albidocapillata]SDM40953.1 Tachylectin [Lentzea albidocapillata subsp. violacea]
MSTRSTRARRSGLGAALAGAVGLSLIVAPGVHVASAASSLNCNSAVNVVGVTQQGTVFRYPHQEPENGNFVWSAKQDVPSSGWQIGRALAGPDGVVYHLVGDNQGAASGDLRRLRIVDTPTGPGWATMPGGGQYRSVGNGWARYSQPEHRNKVTVDEKGRLFEINADGKLKMFVWEGGDDGGWTAETGGGKVLDTGWDQYNLIVAAGDGVLYARKPDGQLFRFRYDAVADRFLQYGLYVGAGWNMFNRVFSPGGDILYGTWPGPNGQGELLWYRYLEDSNTWAPGDPNTNLGKVVGTGWYNELDVVAYPGDCRLVGYPTTPRPVVQANFTAPLTLVEGTTAEKLANYFFVNDQGTLYHGKQRHSGDLLLVDHQPLNGYTKYTGRPAAALNTATAVGSTLANTLEVQAHSHDDAETRGKTQVTPNGYFPADGPVLRHRGHLAGDSVLAKGSDGLQSSFGVGAEGQLWYRKQIAADGRFTAWRSLGGSGLTSDFTVVPNGSSFDVVARHTDNSVRVARLTGTTLGTWTNLGGTDVQGMPAAVLHDDGTVRVLVRRTDNKIYTQKQNSAGFPGAWTVVDGLVTAGSPTAVVTASNAVEVAARGNDNLIYTTGKSQETTGFRAWEVRDVREAATDPTMVRWSDNSLLVAWRDPMGEVYAYRGTFGPALTQRSATASTAGTAPTYTGGKTKS